MSRYNVKTLDKSIKDVDKMLVHNLEAKDNMHKLKWSFIRIKRALKPKFWLHDELQKEIMKLRKEYDTEGQRQYWKITATRKAKTNLIKSELYLLQLLNEQQVPWSRTSNPLMRWEDFKFYLQKQYEGDRKLLKEGKL